MARGLSVRSATAADAGTILRFTNALVQDHRPGGQPATVSLDDVKLAGFGPDPLFAAVIAEYDGRPVGFASFFRGYAGWRGKAVAIVHAVFVDRNARGMGVARRMMAQVALVAMQRGWARVELIIEDERPAIRFYEELGMMDMRRRYMRLGGEQMVRLAAEAQGD